MHVETKNKEVGKSRILKKINFFPVIKTLKGSEEEKQIKLELAKQNVKGHLQLQGIYMTRQLEAIKNIDVGITNCVVEHHSKELTKNLLRYWEEEFKLTEYRTKDEFQRKV